MKNSIKTYFREREQRFVSPDMKLKLKNCTRHNLTVILSEYLSKCDNEIECVKSNVLNVGKIEKLLSNCTISIS